MAQEGYNDERPRFGPSKLWLRPEDMAHALASRHVMGLYFDDKEVMGGKFGGWTQGTASCGWKFDPEWIADLSTPPVSWFGPRDASIHPDRGIAGRYADAAVAVVKRANELRDEVYGSGILAESVYEAFGEIMDPDLAEDSTRPVSWALEIVDSMSRHRVPMETVLQWRTQLDARFTALAAVRLKRRYRLYDFQIEALAAWTRAGRGILNLPTATGKTVIGIEAIAKVAEDVEWPRILVLVPSRLLASQWVRELKLKLFLPKLFVGPGIPGPREAGVWIATQQQLLAANARRNWLASQGRFDLVVVDEVHHSLTNAERGFGGLVKGIQSARKLGLSASVPEDHAREILGEVVHSLDFQEALRRGILPRFRMVFTPCPVSDDDRREYDALSERLVALSPPLVRKGEGNPEFLEWLGESGPWDADDYLDWAKYANKTDEEVREYAGTAQRRDEVLDNSRPKVKVAAQQINLALASRVGFVMADRVDFAEEIYKDLRGIPGLLAHNNMPESARDKALEEFRRATDRTVLVAAQIANEGLDVPAASIAFSVSSPRTILNLTQRLGRILRQKPGKPEPVFHQYESIPDWTQVSDLESPAVVSSVVARFAARAQSAMSLGCPLGVEWPAGTPMVSLEQARHDIGTRQAVSADPAVGRGMRRASAATRAFKRLTDRQKAEVQALQSTSLDVAIAALAGFRGDATVEQFIRDHGVYHHLFGPHALAGSEQAPGKELGDPLAKTLPS